MDGLKIDEKHIGELINSVIHEIQFLTKGVEMLRDKDNDLFIRYMVMVRLGACLNGIRNHRKMAKHIFSLGFNLNHPVFQTEEAKANGWGEIKIHNNPIFEQPENEDDSEINITEINGETLPEDLRKSLLNFVIGHIKAKNDDQLHTAN